MIKEEIDKNKESTNKVEYKDQAISKLVQSIMKPFDILFDFQTKSNEQIFNRLNKIIDFVHSQIKLNQHQSDSVQLTLKALTELDEKNEILKKQVDILHKEIELLQKELDQLKGQGK